MAKKIGQVDFKEIWTIPNIITYFRIICVPVFATLMALAGVRDDFTLFYIALGVFFFASGSDLLDGWIARKFNMQSGIGMVLDPIADKLMNVTGLTDLGQNLVRDGVLDNPWFVHYAFVILIFAKEFIQAMIALYVLKNGATVKANWLGKVSSFTISVGVILAFFHNYVQYADWGILAWGIALSYAAAFSYLNETMKQVKLVKEGKMQAATAESVKEEDQRIVQEKKDGTYEG